MCVEREIHVEKTCSDVSAHIITRDILQKLARSPRNPLTMVTTGYILRVSSTPPPRGCSQMSKETREHAQRVRDAAQALFLQIVIDVDGLHRDMIEPISKIIGHMQTETLTKEKGQ
jgi:hypothetical protein